MKRLILATTLLFSALFSFSQTAVKLKVPTISNIEQQFKINCCFKVVLPSVNFHRPSKACKKGFSLCVTKLTVCFLCNFDGTTPNCPACANNFAKNVGDIELSGSIVDGMVSFKIPASLQSSPEFIGEDLSVFTLENDVQIVDNLTQEVKSVIKAGTYHSSNTIDMYLGKTILINF